jgi:FAD/FMN-containing dehydrogenase
MKLSSWGNYPKFKTDKIVSSIDDIQNHLKLSNNIIAQGNLRSYGDSAFADIVIDMKRHNLFLDFNLENGIIECQSGVLFGEILEVCIPKGWLIPVLPGTQFITLGGAIASDIHGKNHHKDGTISEFIESFHLMLADGSIIECSKKENVELFHATLGGMGLTGIILDAKLRLTPLKSTEIVQQTIKTIDLKQTLKVFEDHLDSPYSVAWFDCLSDEVGKSIVLLGKHDDNQDSKPINYQYKPKLSIPFYFPSFLLNKWSVKLFNWLYYKKAKIGTTKVSLQNFFFPLDSISNWNKIYGKKGFVQYQCVLPLQNSEAGLTEILNKIQSSGHGSFLAVLKRMGAENKNLLSFPMSGYTLALDFKANKNVFKLLNELDQIVLAHHGRIYLCKDSRTDPKHLELYYPQMNEFKKIRNKHQLHKTFNSSQSARLKL